MPSIEGILGGVRFGGQGKLQLVVTITENLAKQSKSITKLFIAGTGFSTTAKENVVTLTSGIGIVVSATTTLLIVSLVSPPALGVLKAVVTVNGYSSTQTQVANLVIGPSVSKRTALSNTANPIFIINGSGFSATAAENTVEFNLGAVGTVTAATDQELTITFANKPDAGEFTAVVTTNGVISGKPVQVANMINGPVITPSTAALEKTTGAIEITGTGFNPNKNTDKVKYNSVVFSGSAQGKVVGASETRLMVAMVTPPDLGVLKAQVVVRITSQEYLTSSQVQVATIVTPKKVSRPNVRLIDIADAVTNAVNKNFAGLGINIVAERKYNTSYPLNALRTLHVDVQIVSEEDELIERDGTAKKLFGINVVVQKQILPAYGNDPDVSGFGSSTQQDEGRLFRTSGTLRTPEEKARAAAREAAAALLDADPEPTIDAATVNDIDFLADLVVGIFASFELETTLADEDEVTLIGKEVTVYSPTLLDKENRFFGVVSLMFHEITDLP